MNILLISAYFFPTNSPRSFRTTELAKELARQGHTVKVIFPDTGYDYQDWDKHYPSLVLSPIKELVWKDTVLKGSAIAYLFRRIKKRLSHLLFEYPAIEWFVKMPRILKHEGKYDLLISIAVPHTIHWGISRCIKKGIKPGKIWVADCGDPFMGCVTDTFRHPFYFAWFERSFCKHADYITIPVESAKEGYYPEFHHKIRIIPQGFNFKEIEKAEYNSHDCPHFCYAGGFIAGIRDPRPILDMLARTGQDFRFYIFTNQKDLLAAYTDILKEKLLISPYIPRLELIKFMSTMDFLLNIENGTSVQIPSKLIDYSLAGRPILSIASSLSEENKLLAFLNNDYSAEMILDNIPQYNIENIAKCFINLVR